jgi:beta-glucosidase 2, glycosyl-hydrolase family 116 N-term
MMLYYYIWEKYWRGNDTTFNPLSHSMVEADLRGMPLGGIGSGSITRSYAGDFTRWNIVKPCIHHNAIVPIN